MASADHTSDAIACGGAAAILIKVTISSDASLVGTLYVKGNTSNDSSTWYNEKWRNNSGDYETSKTVSGGNAIYTAKIIAPPAFVWTFLDQSSGTASISVEYTLIG